MKLIDVIKIVVLNQTVKSSTSRGNNSASDVTGNKLLYSSDQWAIQSHFLPPPMADAAWVGYKIVAYAGNSSWKEVQRTPKREFLQ